MQTAQIQKLRSDILGCLNSIRLSLEVVRDSHDQTEKTSFLDCVGNEVVKVERLVDDLIYGEAEAAPPKPVTTYQFIPLSDQ